MLFTCLFIAKALGAQSFPSVDVKIEHRRASQVLEIMDRSDSMRRLGIEADDAKGCLIVQGSSEKVKEVRDIVKLLDVARKRLSVKVSIDSAVDKESYQVSTKIYSGQEWKTGDGDTGILLAITPRLNDDRSVTVYMSCQRTGSTEISEVFRLKPGKSQTITLGSKVKNEILLGSDGKLTEKPSAVPEPKVTIRVDA